jgi:uncharacterized protein (DUF952 family)
VPYIYHIADQNHWELAQTNRMYVHPTLHSEGFIHCSAESQVEATANIHFNTADEILLLYIDPSKLESDIKYEMASRGEEFPHIYGPVNIESVVKTKRVKRRADGHYRIRL